MEGSSASHTLVGSQSAENTWQLKKAERYTIWADDNPKKAAALKYGTIALVIVLVVGGLIAWQSGALQQLPHAFSTGFEAAKQFVGNVITHMRHFLDNNLPKLLQSGREAFAATEKFMHQNVNLTYGQWGLIGGGAVGAVALSYLIPKHNLHRKAFEGVKSLAGKVKEGAQSLAGKVKEGAIEAKELAALGLLAASVSIGGLNQN